MFHFIHLIHLSFVDSDEIDLGRLDACVLGPLECQAYPPQDVLDRSRLLDAYPKVQLVWEFGFYLPLLAPLIKSAK